MTTAHTVDPRVIAEHLQMDTHDLTKLLCGYASDELMTFETWNEMNYEPASLDDFDEATTRARLHLETANEAWKAWKIDNPEFFATADEES